MHLLATTLATLLLATEPELNRFQAAEVHMGTRFEIVLHATSEELAERATRAAFARIAELDRRLSDYLPESELNRLSRSAPTTEPMKVSQDLLRVLTAAQTLSVRTEGAFDVTVGPLTKLWRRARRRREFPSPQRLAEARAAVGFSLLQIDASASTVELRRPGMRLDLGGIAKGFAGDEALRVLRDHGIPRALVDAGGDVVAGDPPPGETGWRIGVAPLEAGAPPSRFLRVANQAVATSGDAWQFVELDGVRYSHILDPRTGLGLTTRSSVTIIAPSGMAADSLASAVSVLGVERGRKLIDESASIESLLVVQRGDAMCMEESSGFSALLED